VKAFPQIQQSPRGYALCGSQAILEWVAWFPFSYGSVWYAGPNAATDAIGYAQHHSRSHDAVIRVYDAAGNLIETHEHSGNFKDW
jgi:hypothetical protein